MTTKVRLIAAMAMLSCSCFAHAYELATHARLTYKAYEQSVLFKDQQFLKNLGIDAAANAPFGDVYYDVSDRTAQERKANPFEAAFMVDQSNPPAIPPNTSPVSVQGWLLRGAIREDDWARAGGIWWAPNPQDDTDQPQAFWRIMNHFYDPVRDAPLTLNAAQASLFQTFTGEDTGFHTAPAWAIGATNANAFNQPTISETGRRNHYSLFDARESLWRALTLKIKNPDGSYTDLGPSGSLKTKNDVRNAYWATTFRALGDVVHLVEDMGQPQHTRNDLHSGKPGFGHESIYELYVECRATGGVTKSVSGYGFPDEQCPGLPYDGYTVPAFTKFSDFFSTREGMNGRGLADYSNRGFFSAGTNLGNKNYPAPSNNASAYLHEQVALTTVDQGYQTILAPLSILKGSVPDTLSNQPATNVPLTTEGMWYKPLADFSTPANAQAWGYTLTRPNYDAQANLLIPRAVAYSAGLINYFFRGRINAEDVSFTDTGLTLRVRNTIDLTQTPQYTGENLVNEATLIVAYDYLPPNAKSEAARVVGSSDPVALTENLKPDQSSLTMYSFTIPPTPANATDVHYRLVYRGRLGKEDDEATLETRSIA